MFIADDEPALRSLIQEVLESQGYEVDAFPDGQALLDQLDTAIPDLVFLDINMPGLDGWEVRARLLEDPRTQAVPVVAVTARGGTAVEQSAKEALQFTDLVRKPFQINDLLDAAANALAAQAADGHQTEAP